MCGSVTGASGPVDPYVGSAVPRHGPAAAGVGLSEMAAVDLVEMLVGMLGLAFAGKRG
jgi:hypothetical protein